MEIQGRMWRFLCLVSLVMVFLAIVNAPSTEATFGVGDDNGLAPLLGLGVGEKGNLDGADDSLLANVADEENLLLKEKLDKKEKTPPPLIIKFKTPAPTPPTTECPPRYIPPRFKHY